MDSNILEERYISRPVTINNVKLFSIVQTELNMGFIKIFSKAFDAKEICINTKLCEYRLDRCADVSNIESDCNNTTNFYGQTCKHYVACSAINKYSEADIKKCELLETKSDCAEDSDCKVGYSTCEPERSSLITTGEINSENVNANITEEPVKGTCTFRPMGDNKQHCLDRCLSGNIVDGKSTEDCSEDYCIDSCEGCDDFRKCKWLSTKIDQAVTILKTPSSPKIRGYSSNRAIKLVWIRPKSEYPITKYTCVIESPDLTDVVRVNFPNDLTCDRCEYTIQSLNNSAMYYIYVIASNGEGDSQPSNILAIQPRKEGILPEFSSEKTHVGDLPSLDDSVNERVKKLSDEKAKELSEMSLEDYRKMIDSAEVKESKVDKDYSEMLNLLVNAQKVNYDRDTNFKINFT